MKASLTIEDEQLLGLDDSHLVADAEGRLLHPDCWRAFEALRNDAATAGFDLCIASAWRGFERQRDIFNRKARGERPLHDDTGAPLVAAELDDATLLHAILRFSALPGGSRHHWGSDMDVYDAAAVPADYAVQLVPGEVADDGVFGPFHGWLDGRIAAGESQGFFRPYASDRGGVAPERWHLSFAPVAQSCAIRLDADLLWSVLADCELELKDSLARQWPDIYARYIACEDGH